jgi:hypothetical protein
MAGGRGAPEGKSEPYFKCTAIFVEKKVRMICEYECGKGLFAITHKLGYMVSAVNTIVNVATSK